MVECTLIQELRTIQRQSWITISTSHDSKSVLVTCYIYFCILCLKAKYLNPCHIFLKVMHRRWWWNCNHTLYQTFKPNYQMPWHCRKLSKMRKRWLVISQWYGWLAQRGQNYIKKRFPIGNIYRNCCKWQSALHLYRVFSNFGLMQTKIRNKLGVDKAEKLVFYYRMLRGKWRSRVVKNLDTKLTLNWLYIFNDV